ncbi:KIR protein [Plasmodium coatneyi]|uniref:KIR protein n=1 Tax=Plasmodium coatneyi TaxID=208452 RepID=A0A1B1E625_9APIC|nr:KIR protein [Plasmodium coatneyi]ANQ10461.1 KIR protein [Plasmodium coatneyi]
MAKPAEGTSYLQAANLQMLDSRKLFYNTVDGNGEGSVQVNYVYCQRINDTGKKIEGKLKECTEIGSNAEKIANGLCYVLMKKKEAQAPATDTKPLGRVPELPPPPGPPGLGDTDEFAESAELDKSFNKSLCHFLYYWLGKEVWESNGSLSSSKFLEVMKKIYEALQLFNVKDNCKLLYDDTTPNKLPSTTTNLTKDLFGYRKTVFDFTFDYEGIKKKLAIVDNNSCDEGYYKHLAAAKTALEIVKQDCEGKGPKWDKDPYCKEFRNKYDLSNNNKNPLTLTINVIQDTSEKVTRYNITNLVLKYTAQYMQELAKKHHDTAAEVEQIAAGPIVSSAVASLVGLPTILFLLYKVTIWAHLKYK